MLDYAGYDVERHYYVNDAGRQVAVFTWAFETFEESDLPDPEREKHDYHLVRYYRKGKEFLEEGDPNEVAAAEAEITTIMQELEAGDEETFERVGRVVDTVLAGMQETLGRLPAEFDEFVKETRFIRDGSTDDVVARLKDTDRAVYDEDAWQLDLPDIDKNLVFLRADGTSLYTTRDVAHHEWKFENFDHVVTVLGEDHGLQAQQIETTLELLGHDTSSLDQVLYSYVNLPEGKMSTHAGTGIDLDDLLDEAIERAREEVESRMGDRIWNDDITEDDAERIARQVGIGAVRYDIVAKQPSKAITFEWEPALDFEAQSAPYLQYVHARAWGILGRATAANYSVPDPGEFDAGTLESEEARALLRIVARLPAVIEESAEALEPHLVATYTRGFAEAFNAFYRECPVLEAPRRYARRASHSWPPHGRPSPTHSTHWASLHPSLCSLVHVDSGPAVCGAQGERHFEDAVVVRRRGGFRVHAGGESDPFVVLAAVALGADSEASPPHREVDVVPCHPGEVHDDAYFVVTFGDLHGHTLGR